MKITILNGNPDVNNHDFDNYLKDLSNLLESINHSSKVLVLREMNIKYCTGCFDCWIKKPGECIFSDDSSSICREYINSDLVFFASPIIMGFTSALLKKANDKLVPLLLYHQEFVQDENHHKARYNSYPQISLILERAKGTDKEDIKIISDIYRRDALNMKTTLGFVKFTEDKIQEIVDEINSV
jgi:multimeric flavodoxin WrbA